MLYINIIKSKRDHPHYSHIISAMCKALDDAQKDYDWSRSEVARMERLTQDYLHKMELEDLGYKERAKVDTKLQNCRQLRRAHKDTAEILEPLVQYLSSDRGKNLCNLLKEALGKTRRVEERMDGRIYYPRELKGE